jgi:hypothetical protein
MGDFLTSVWKWKYAAVAIWCFVIYLLFSLILLLYSFFFGLEGIWGTYPLVLLGLALEIYFYVPCLTVVPVLHTVLSLQDFVKRLKFYACLAIPSFLTFVAVGTATSATYLTISVICVLVFLLDFTVFIQPLHRIDRIQALRRRFRPPMKSIIFIALISTIVASPFTSIIAIPFLILQILILSITSIVFGERVSFATKSDCSRLLMGLKSFNQPLIQLWAYSDLFEVSRDPKSSRRQFIYRDGGQTFKDVADAIFTLIDTFGNENQDLNEKVKDKRPIFQLNSAQRARGRAQDFDGFAVTEKPKNRFILKFWKRYLSDLWSLRTRKMRLREAEAKATAKSIFVMKAAEAFANLLFRSEIEDEFGGVQLHTERFIEVLGNVKRDLDRTAHGTWITPPFGFPWIASGYADLSDQVWRVVDWVLEKVLKKFGKRIDVTMMSKRNAMLVSECGAIWEGYTTCEEEEGQVLMSRDTEVMDH